MDKNILSQTSFLLTFKIYRLLAWNPLDENKTKTQIVYFVIAVFYGFLCFVKEMIYFVLHLGEENNFLVLTNNLPCAGFVVLTMAKISPIYVHRKVLIEMLKDLQEMNKLFLKINFLELRFVKISKKMLTIFTVLFMILIWIFNLMPLIKMGHSAIVGNQVIRQLPYYMWYPFDVHQPIVFEICYVIVNWGAFTCALGILTSDLLLCSFITLICMQFHNLKSRINEIIDKKKSDDILKFWIDNHSKLLVMCAEIEKIFSFSVLVNYTGSSIIICLAGFQTQVQGNEATELIKFCLYLISSLIQIFVICWHGEMLIKSSSEISQEIYSSLWYELDSKSKKQLQMIMMRSQKPETLTAFKFSEVSLNSFMVVIGSSFSYLSCMRSIYSQQE